MAEELRCAICNATHKQSRVTVAKLDRLKPALRGEIAAQFDTAHHCGVCGAVYLFPERLKSSAPDTADELRITNLKVHEL